MKKRLGKRIELLIFSKGFDSRRSFAKYMAENKPEICVGSQTISNVIEGKNTQIDTIKAIAECLELPLEVLINENLVLIDDFLKNEIEPIMMEKGEDLSAREYAIETVKYLYDVSKRFCPCSISDEFGLNDGFHISTLAELALYLPLCKFYLLSDFVSRIGGDVERREGYILKQSEYLYDHIPNIPAKRYVDNHIKTYRIAKKEKLNENEVVEKESLEKYWESEECERDYTHYFELVKRWLELSQDNTMRVIFEQNFPEIYAEEIEYRKGYMTKKWN